MATRKRRRFKIKSSSCLAALLGLLSSLLLASASHQQPQTVGHLCALLPHYLTRHLKLCKLIERTKNAGEAVAVGASRGLAECRQQFKNERWNCTHVSHPHPGRLHWSRAELVASADHLLLTSELAQSTGNRESAFVQAIAAAGIVHSVATACSVGSLSDCACDKTRIGLIRRQEENWKWGGCSNNIRQGMVYAKHLVELLDVVHQHHLLHQDGTRAEPSQSHSLSRRSVTAQTLQRLNKQSNFCLKNQSISLAAHHKLIRSILSKNSLEKHHEIRLAMNMHNNKVGRMAVARNMELRCRCHGLSGSCSLKTCWLTLPNFQVIGAYLKRKYESSVHLPSAVNVNKLIPMMDRNELSAILSGNEPDPPSSPASNQPEFAALTLGRAQLSGHFILGTPTTATPTAGAAHLEYYERHKQLAETRSRAHQPAEGSAGAPEPDEPELPANLAPMSLQQYQALLRDTKLCNTSTSLLATRDLNNARQAHRLTASQPAEQSRSSAHQQTTIGHQLKSANQHLSQLLAHSNRDDLIHLHKSPDYCEADLRHGFAGIQSRTCSDSPLAPDFCDKFCCGRGYTTHVIQHSYKCDCEFEYCCSIKCKVCTKEIKMLVCN